MSILAGPWRLDAGAQLGEPGLHLRRLKVSQTTAPEMGENILLDPRLVAEVSVQPTAGSDDGFQPVREPLADRQAFRRRRDALLLIAQRGSELLLDLLPGLAIERLPLPAGDG